MIDLNKIYNTDCVGPEGMCLIPDKSIDMILCDLPYGTTNCKWDVIIPFDKLWSQYERVIKNNGVIVLFGAEPFSSLLRLSNVKLFKYDWIWDKIKGTGFLNAKKQPMRNHETISVFYKNQCLFNPQMTCGHVLKKTFRGKHHQTEVYGEMKNNYRYESTERFPRSIQEFSTDTQNSSLHPTQKPVDLLRYLIRTYTNQGDVILDNCMGSGSTGIACLMEDRKFIGFENDTKHGYYSIAIKRINQHIAQQSLFSEGAA